MGEGFKEWTYVLGAVAVPLVLAVGINRGCNNQAISHPGYHAVSKANGLSGHTEYVKYADGSQEVKIYPGLGHGLFSSRLLEDFNGDSLIDRIRENSGTIQANKLKRILIRDFDSTAYKEEFAEADRELQEQIIKLQERNSPTPKYF
ncbi:hypothetical protein HYT23_05480 [Candidatus Pacearchaeota archaeon]|nr:hypothetical protein [Candidatus Pacearchaeota archaeon]